MSQSLDRAGMTQIDVLVDGRDVMLRGTVADESIRKYAEQVVAGAPGVRQVSNLIEVVR